MKLRWQEVVRDVLKSNTGMVVSSHLRHYIERHWFIIVRHSAEGIVKPAVNTGDLPLLRVTARTVIDRMVRETRPTGRSWNQSLVQTIILLKQFQV